MESFSKPSASAIIEKTINNEKYVLIQERYKEDAPSEQGLLEIPGGKIREFENIYDCLRREVKEETGLDIIRIQGESGSSIIECHGYKVLSYVPFSPAQNIRGYYPIMVDIFICEAGGDLLTATNESKNLRWVSMEKLTDLIKNHIDNFYPMHIPALRKYLNSD